MQRGRLPYSETHPLPFGAACHWTHHGLPLACLFFQQAAGAHASRLGVGLDALLPQGLSWVLSALRVQRLRRVPTPATLTLETGPTGAASRIAHRDFTGFADDDTAACVCGSSRWMMVRTTDGRPVPMPQAVRDLVPEPHPAPLVEVPPRLPEVTAEAAERRFEVRRYDLDINDHANNVRLIEMAVESVPDDLWGNGSLQDLAVIFRTSAVYGEALRAAVAVTRTADGWEALHALHTADTGRAVLQARSLWTPSNDAPPGRVQA